VTNKSLSAEERESLERNGYLVLHGVLKKEHLRQLAGRLDELLESLGKVREGARCIDDLVNRDLVFRPCWTYPRVLAAVAYVLYGDLRLYSLHGRSAPPGEGYQALHQDYSSPERPGDWRLCNSIWLLDDFTEENGATRFVPASHLGEAGATNADSREMVLRAPAGSVCIFNGHLLHGGTKNRSRAPRRALHAAFAHRNIAQQDGCLRETLSGDALRNLSSAERYILDVG
jgi:ectoine hydroxylase-related dioxygenase (phytanoyl-CoA dioxygenase family)